MTNPPPYRCTWAVMPAGGSGQRFSSSSSGQNKLLADLGGQPVITRTAEALLRAPEIQGLVIAAPDGQYDTLMNALQAQFPDKPIRLTPGGDTRRASVFCGLCALPPDVDRVVVHDAARPLVSTTLVSRVIQAVTPQTPGAIVAIPVYDTIKRATPPTQDGYAHIETTLDRQTLWRAQTPQVFVRAQLEAAHQRVPQAQAVTDDAQLMELCGLGPVALIPGTPHNLKITTLDDWQLAQRLWAGAGL